jgi:hypothetical protein
MLKTKPKQTQFMVSLSNQQTQLGGSSLLQPVFSKLSEVEEIDYAVSSRRENVRRRLIIQPVVSQHLQVIKVDVAVTIDITFEV